MGSENECGVEFYILAEHEKLFEDNFSEDWTKDSAFPVTPALSAYFYEEVPYGELDCGDDTFFERLYNLGIAFDATWEAGQDWNQGTKSGRFTSDGNLVIKELYDIDLLIKPGLIRGILDNVWLDPPDRVNAITTIISAHEKRVHVLPWQKQAEYGRIHRTKKLIGAPTECGVSYGLTE